MFYLSHLGKEQLDQLVNREKIEKILIEKQAPQKTLESLEFVFSVKSYGVSSLGLSSDSGFEYFVPLKRKEVGWNVSATKPLEFSSHTWWFPIAGEVPYKGFFDIQLAKEEEAKLKEMGLDTRIRAIGGYSTLGWLSDPVFSPQLEWTKPELAGLVFHEMAHATAYLQGDSVFNESYASFVEKKGVEKYYKENPSSDYHQFVLKQTSKKNVIALIKNTAETLQTLYNSDLPIENKLTEKNRIIQDFKNQAIEKGFVLAQNKEKFLANDWNNEDFSGILRYKSGEKYFQKVFMEVKEDFPSFHKKVLEYDSLSPEDKIKAMEE
jgi:predicted aminopeptidase